MLSSLLLLLVLGPWVAAIIFMVIKKRPIMVLGNFLLCALVLFIYLTGGKIYHSPPVTEGPVLQGIGKGIGNVAGDIFVNIGQAIWRMIISTFVAAGWGVCMLVHAINRQLSNKPEIQELKERWHIGAMILGGGGAVLRVPGLFYRTGLLAQ